MHRVFSGDPMMKKEQEDLVVLVADLDMEETVNALLDRPEALAIRRLTFRVKRYTGRDAGVRQDCVEFLRLYQKTHRYALVMFDLHGSGGEKVGREDLEANLKGKLRRSGWENRADVIVLDPELETWVWSDSPHVADSLGYKTQEDLREFLRGYGWQAPDRDKPAQPKEAMEAALRDTRRPRSAAIFGEIAARVTLGKCQDAAFLKFRAVLQNWFSL